LRRIGFIGFGFGIGSHWHCIVTACAVGCRITALNPFGVCTIDTSLLMTACVRSICTDSDHPMQCTCVWCCGV